MNKARNRSEVEKVNAAFGMHPKIIDLGLAESNLQIEPGNKDSTEATSWISK